MRGCARAALVAGVVLSGVVPGRKAAAQETFDPLNALQQIPAPLVTAGVPVPARALDWSHYETIEQCTSAFARVVVSASLDLKRDTLRDTTSPNENPWIPLAPAAIQLGRTCLQRIRIAELPALSLPNALRLFIALNEDSLIPTLVARQLGLAQGAAGRAEVLDSAVEALMTNYWEPIVGDGHLTTAHIQLAHTFLAQADSLGPIAFVQRVQMRNKLLQPAQYAHDLQAQLAIHREIQQVLEHTPFASIPPSNTMQRQFYIFWQGTTAVRVAELTYLLSLSHADLRKFVEARMGLMKLAGPGAKSPDLVGMAAPPVTADYWFNTPASDTHPVVPAPGKISVMLFGRGDGEGGKFADLRRIHHELPDVAITLVAQTAGVIGNEFLVDSPEQEAAGINHYFTDSLQLSGAVAVIKTKFQTVPDGHVFPLNTVTWDAYQIQNPGTVVIVDPTGMIVYEGENGKPFENGLADFVRRLHEKFMAPARDANSR